MIKTKARSSVGLRPRRSASRYSRGLRAGCCPTVCDDDDAFLLALDADILLDFDMDDGDDSDGDGERDDGVCGDGAGDTTTPDDDAEMRLVTRVCKAVRMRDCMLRTESRSDLRRATASDSAVGE